MNYNADVLDNSFLDLTDLFRSEDFTVDFDREISLEEIDLSKEFEIPVNIKGTVKNSLGIISFKAQIKGIHKCICARCAEDIKLLIESKIDTLITLSESKDDSVSIENGTVDLAKTAYDALSLEIPMVVLCDESCKGLCPKCGINLNNHQCNCV